MEETSWMREQGQGRERRGGHGHAVAITGPPRVLTAVLGVLFLAAALVYVFSTRLVLTPTLTCQVSRPSLCRVWVDRSPDPVIAAVLLVIAGVLLIMAITGRGWVFSFGGASLAPAPEATGTTPEDVPPDAEPLHDLVGLQAHTSVDAGPDAPHRPPGVALFTRLPADIRDATAAKWASWYPDSPIGTALQEVRRVPGYDGPYYLRLRTPGGDDRWLRASERASERASSRIR